MREEGKYQITKAFLYLNLSLGNKQGRVMLEIGDDYASIIFSTLWGRVRMEAERTVS